MQVVRHLARRRVPLPRSVLTLGNFDGVHRGHQTIVRTARERAAALGARTAVLTFEPHPLAVLAPERAPAIIQPLHDRLAALRDLGVDAVVLQRFTPKFAAMEAEEFVREFLLRHVELVHVVVGYNVNFGRGRAGSAHTLRELGPRLGFGVDDVGPVSAEGEDVSSTRLREAIRQGDMARARRLLGRPYALRGRVVGGDRRGRTLGFPTANLHLKPGILLPPDGVYAITAEADGVRRAGVLNVGVRPTFGGLRRTVEAHLLDFDGDLYRRWLRVHLVARLRGEVRFAGVDALRAQIADDVAHARRVLAAEPA